LDILGNLGKGTYKRQWMNTHEGTS
jgi:hypothetical protein